MISGGMACVRVIVMVNKTDAIKIVFTAGVRAFERGISMVDDRSDGALTSLRAAIDDVDGKLTVLLEQRGALVADMAALKAAEGLPIRPAREAEILSRVTARAQDKGWSRPLLFAIWREILSASSNSQQSLRLAVHRAVVENWPLLEEIRRRFGHTPELCVYSSSALVLQALSAARLSTIGILPLAAESVATPLQPKRPWWCDWDSDSFCAFELLGDRSQGWLLALGALPLAASGRDLTLCHWFFPGVFSAADSLWASFRESGRPLVSAPPAASGLWAGLLDVMAAQGLTSPEIVDFYQAAPKEAHLLLKLAGFSQPTPWRGDILGKRWRLLGSFPL